jgi:hypothetical protein
LLFAKFDSDRLVLADKKRNKLAWEILREFSNGIDRLRDKRKLFQGPSEDEEMFREYLTTVQKATDEKSQRLKRLQILDNLLRSIFVQKDSQRLFSAEQRRLIWNTTKERKCKECGTILTWENFTIDHIDPHSKGGRSVLGNAALMCKRHNSSKGNRL